MKKLLIVIMLGLLAGLNTQADNINLQTNEPVVFFLEGWDVGGVTFSNDEFGMWIVSAQALITGQEHTESFTNILVNSEDGNGNPIVITNILENATLIKKAYVRQEARVYRQEIGEFYGGDWTTVSNLTVQQLNDAVNLIGLNKIKKSLNIEQ
jgi:hypothetical protein